MAQVRFTPIKIESNHNGSFSIYTNRLDSTHLTLSLAIERIFVLLSIGYASALESGEKIKTAQIDEIFNCE